MTFTGMCGQALSLAPGLGSHTDLRPQFNPPDQDKFLHEKVLMGHDEIVFRWKSSNLRQDCSGL